MVCTICRSVFHLHTYDEKLDNVVLHLIEAVCKELIPVVHHNEEKLGSSVFHEQQQFVFDSLNMIETKIAQCLQIQTHYEDDVVKFHEK